MFDVTPTLVHFAGGNVPTDRKIDGADIWPLLAGEALARNRQARCLSTHYRGLETGASVRAGPLEIALRLSAGSGGRQECRKRRRPHPFKTNSIILKPDRRIHGRRRGPSRGDGAPAQTRRRDEGRPLCLRRQRPWSPPARLCRESTVAAHRRLDGIDLAQGYAPILESSQHPLARRGMHTCRSNASCRLGQAGVSARRVASCPTDRNSRPHWQ